MEQFERNGTLILRLYNPTMKKWKELSIIWFSTQKKHKWKNYVTLKKIGNIINKLKDRSNKLSKYIYIYI